MYKQLKESIQKLKTGGYGLNEFYRMYGQCQMAYTLKAITHDEFMKLNHDVMADGINNPEYMHR